ncbi:MAG: 2-oxoacid:acceptor oxidoreductase family protein [Thermoplasmata archaeon]
MFKIRIGGWAGQGTVRAGSLLGKSLAIEQGYDVVQKRSYSAAVRSGIAYSDVISDKENVDELVIDVPDFLLILYQKTLDEWKSTAEKSRFLIVDSTRVDDIPEIKGETHRVPAGQIAEDIATAKAANVVLLGALANVSDDIELESLKKIVKSDFSEKYVDMNLEALEKGYEEIEKEGK